MILKFTYENFKSFEKAELTLHQLTTLIGANASGKSNAIEGIKILSMLVTGLDLGFILDGTQNMESQIRGGSKGCKRFRTSAFKLGCRIASEEAGRDILYEIKIGVNGRIVVDEEGLYLVDREQPDSREDKIFKAKSAIKDSLDIKVEYRNGMRGRNPDMLCIRSSAILPQMVNRVPRESLEEARYASYMEEVVENLRRIIVLNPNPAMMRDYCRITDLDIRTSCNNISALLMAICNDTEKKNHLLEFMSRLPENEIEDISFIKTRIGDVIFALKEKYMNSSEVVDAKKLSDGTLRSIAIIATLLIAPVDSLIVVEEVDNGIHPARLEELIRVLCECVEKNGSDLLISTHNASMLNKYQKDELVGVSVVYREKEKGTSKIITLLQIEELPDIVLNGLGNAMISDRLVKVIKEEKKIPDISWMGAIK